MPTIRDLISTTLLSAVVLLAASERTHALPPLHVLGFNATRAGVMAIDSPIGWLGPLRDAISEAFPGSSFTGTPVLRDAYFSGKDVVILSMATSGNEVITPLDEQEQNSLASFVESGGSALIFVDGDGFAQADQTNESLIDAFGLDVSGNFVDRVIFEPTDLAIAFGPFGSVSGLQFTFSGSFDVGPHAHACALFETSGLPGIACVDPGALAPGRSGLVVIFGDTSMIFGIEGLFCPDCRSVVLNSLAIVSGLPDGPCSADFDGDGTVAVPDIFTFLAVWFTGDALLANYNEDCCVNAADIFAFLADWFAGC